MTSLHINHVHFLESMYQNRTHNLATFSFGPSKKHKPFDEDAFGLRGAGPTTLRGRAVREEGELLAVADGQEIWQAGQEGPELPAGCFPFACPFDNHVPGSLAKEQVSASSQTSNVLFLLRIKVGHLERAGLLALQAMEVVLWCLVKGFLGLPKTLIFHENLQMRL